MHETDWALRVDLDYTLLDTNKFFFTDGVIALLEADFGVDRAAFMANMQGHAGPGENSHDVYDFFGQIRGLGLDDVAVEVAILAQLRSDEYLYPGAVDFIDQIVLPHPDAGITTYGEHRYQMLKHACTPALAKVAFRTTVQQRGPYLRSSLQGKLGIVVDDKIIENLPDNFLQVHVRHDGKAPIGAYTNFADVIADWPQIVGH